MNKPPPLAPAGPRGRGRPRGNPPTRASIVSAARPLFVERGYRATTLRAVARAAGVDPAAIAYHFGSKKALFADVMQVHCANALTVDRVLAGDPATLPDRLIDTVTGLWEDPDFRKLTSQGEEVAAAVRDYLESELLARLVEFLGGRTATARATAVVTVLGGLIYTRYLNPLPTAAALTSDEIRRVLAPALHAALNPGKRPR
ncbi:TetR family transcriptional regulator [Streptomyces sp. NPDC028635]|uniref:TetR/AcrR family transcriptional regulator n=1 Tax=Streptomyces sp. NPDC028635 TaxID=3154800 RepID=UPI0033C52EF7